MVSSIGKACRFSSLGNPRHDITVALFKSQQIYFQMQICSRNHVCDVTAVREHEFLFRLAPINRRGG